MRARSPKFVLAILLVLAAMDTFGQVYSVGAHAGGVTYYPSRWVVGSPPFRFGLEEYSYSTDAAGYIVIGGRATQPGALAPFLIASFRTRQPVSADVRRQMTWKRGPSASSRRRLQSQVINAVGEFRCGAGRLPV
jgi:hypothetical protein